MGRWTTDDRRRGRAGGIVAAALLAAVLAGCASSAASPTTTPGPPTGRAAATDAFYTPPSPLTLAAAGTLIRAVRVTGVPGVPAGARVWRILFHSTTVYGVDEAESGYVIAPAATAPAGGYPVIAWAHGTSGFAATCGPSLFTDAGGGQGPYLIPALDRYLRAGYVVSAADYQGLGVADGVHPYLVGSSEGRAVLDATRATRQLAGLVTSDTVIIYGHSQGGQSALMAAEMAPGYAPGLHVIGVVAAAPATGLDTITAVAGTPLGASILVFTVPMVYSWSRTYHDLPISSVLTPAGARLAAAVVTDGCLDRVAGAIATSHLGPAQLFPPGMGTDPVVLAHAVANSPGHVRTTVPLLVVQGTADQVVPPALTDTYVTTRACVIGDTVEYLHVPGATHDTVVFEAAPTIVAWMDARRAGAPAPTTCGRPGDVATMGP